MPKEGDDPRRVGASLIRQGGEKSGWGHEYRRSLLRSQLCQQGPSSLSLCHPNKPASRTLSLPCRERRELETYGSFPTPPTK